MHTIKPNDYGYASSGCYENGVFYQADGSDYRQDACTSTNWLYNGEHQWTLSPVFGVRYNVRNVHSTAYMNAYTAAYRLGTRPSLYLSTSVKITSGTGTINDMYELSL